MIEIVKIKQNEYGMFFVEYNGMESCECSWDEMMGLVATITMPYTRPCMQWLKKKDLSQAVAEAGWIDAPPTAKSMWDDVPHGTATFTHNGGRYTADGWLAQTSNGSWAFKTDDGTIFDYLHRDEVVFAKDGEKDEV